MAKVDHRWYNRIMTTLQIQTEVPFNVLLDSLPQLGLDELDLLANQVIRLRAQRKTAHIPDAEALLLSKISEGVIPLDLRRRCAELTRKQRAGLLREEEDEELSKIVDEIEIRNAQRVGYLVDLAELRQTTLDKLMSVLEIAPFSYE